MTTKIEHRTFTYKRLHLHTRSEINAQFDSVCVCIPQPKIYNLTQIFTIYCATYSQLYHL